LNLVIEYNLWKASQTMKFTQRLGKIIVSCAK
jgi:hypothetical protein